jgi:hypothetical protein
VGLALQQLHHGCVAFEGGFIQRAERRRHEIGRKIFMAPKVIEISEEGSERRKDG